MEFLKLQRIFRFVNNNTSFINSNNTFGLSAVSKRYASATTEKKEEELYATIEDDDDYELALIKEREVERKRNKSRLLPQHRNMLHGKVPYSEEMDDSHYTIKYKRRIFARYGYQSNLNPGSLWPKAEDLKKIVEYEKIVFPYSLQESILKQQQKIEEEKLAIEQRQQEIYNKLKKLDQWKKEIEDRVAKKLADLAKAKAKKDAIIEDVRKHFGYKLDPQDEKFKEMVLVKERAQKKKLKEERAKAKHERMLDALSKDS